MTDTAGLTKAGAAAAGFAVLWLVLAWNRPGVTFHFGPLVVAATLPYAYVTFAKRRASASAVVAMANAGIAAALVVTALLASADRMTGSSLLPTGGAALEAIVFALVGGAIGLLALLRRAEPDP